MRDYIILTDSCCDFPAEMVEELGVTVLPLSFLLEGKEYFNYPDNREMDPHIFYEKLRAGSLGSTSAINVATFHDAMEPVVSAGKDVLYISFSSALSTTYQSACIAAREVMEATPGATVAVVDSRAASLGQGMLYIWRSRRRIRARAGGGPGLRGGEEGPHRPLVHRGRPEPPQAGRPGVRRRRPLRHHAPDEAGAPRGQRGAADPRQQGRGRKASVKALLDKMEELVEDPSVVFISHGDCLDDAQGLASPSRRSSP